MFHESVVPKLNETLPKLNYVNNRTQNTAVPDINEIYGASFGIARLHTLYSLDTENFVKHGIVDSNFGHVHVKSKPSVKKLSSFDLSTIGDVAYKVGLYKTTLPALEYAMKMLNLENSGQILDSELTDLFEQKMPEHSDIEKLYNETVLYHDQYLLRMGSRFGRRRLFEYPKGNTISKKEAKAIAKREKKNRSQFLRDNRSS